MPFRCSPTTLLLLACVCSNCVLLAWPQPSEPPDQPPPPPPGSDQPQGQDQQQFGAVLGLASELLGEVHCFWSTHGPDPQVGGFYATLDRQGTPVSPTAKTLEQQAQALWFFSEHFSALGDPRVSPLLLRGGPRTGADQQQQQQQDGGGVATCGAFNPTGASAYDFGGGGGGGNGSGPSAGLDASGLQALDRRLADEAHGFMISRMRNASTGLFYTAVSQDGTTVIDAGPEMHQTLTAIAALARYARAFNYDAARDEALSAFLALDVRLHDPTYGGYDETLSVPPYSPYPKTQQGLLLLLAATTELALAAPGNPTVLDRLREAVQLYGTKVVGTVSDSDRRLYGRQVFASDWTPAGEADVPGALAALGVTGSAGYGIQVYGMDLWASWQLLEALPVAYGGGEQGSLTVSEADVKGVVNSIATTAFQDGFHFGKGGFFTSGTAASNDSKVYDKLWWAQVEALPALWQLYGSGAEGSGGYLGNLYDTLTWIRLCQSDQSYGELYFKAYGDCTVAGSFSSGGYEYEGRTKGTAWKGAASSGRGLLTLLQYQLAAAPLSASALAG